MSLGKDGKKRLKLVLELAQNDISNVTRCVEFALKGCNDPARRIYLRGKLRLEACAEIRRKTRGESQRHAKEGSSLRKNSVMMADARRHEKYHQVRLAHDE